MQPPRPGIDSNAGPTDPIADALRSIDTLVQEARAKEASGLNEGVLITLADLGTALESLRPKSGPEPVASAAGGVAMVFDVSDLLGYFPDNRAPTGIQRVQMEVITSLILETPQTGVRLCRFVTDKGHWAEVPTAPFLTVCAASRAGGEPSAQDWRATVEALDLAIRSRGAMHFGPGAVLVNLGSSWWLPDYFLQVRYLKDTHGVRYVPMIHDIIPAATPHFCHPDLVAEFIPWIGDVIDNADFFLANSNATKNDLIAFAEKLGRSIAPDMVSVIPLDADYRASPGTGGSTAQFSSVGRPYVLLVSTLEVRKNQIGALDAWRQLINESGIEAVPQLVLVGKQGFRGNEVYERIAQDETLASRVTILSGIDDEALAALYRGSLFTIYPSAYEGWGLPVTESLCYGRVPLLSDSSSLPEAGGEFAVYFVNGSPSDLLAQLRKLIFDGAFRKGKEEAIKARFQARSWTVISHQIGDAIRAWHGQTDQHRGWHPPTAQVGHYYPIARAKTMVVWRGMGSGEAFRRGVNWWPLEDWGCWSRAAGGRLAMVLDETKPIEIALALRGPAQMHNDFFIRSADGDVVKTDFIEGVSRKWVFLTVPAGCGLFDLTIVANRPLQVGQDHRRIGIGIEGFYVLDASDPQSRQDFVEAVALGSLHDRNFYRRRSASEPA